MSEFRVGDRVRALSGNRLTVGKIYIVTSTNGGDIRVINDEGREESYLLRRWEKAELDLSKCLYTIENGMYMLI